MNLDELVRNIIHIPRDFRRLNDVSVYTLLRRSGYFSSGSIVSVEAIRGALASEPKCVEDWLTYSEDKRCKSGWYFIQTGKNKHTVGFYPTDGKSPITYDDPLDACAVFIGKEIEDIGLSGEN
jgi:hypothetical protein